MPDPAPATAPLTVAIVQGTAQVAGAERQLLAELAGLNSRRVIPRVLLFGDGPLVGLLIDAGADVVVLGNLPRARDVRGWRRVVHRIAAAAAGADVIHAQGEKLVPFAAAAARRAGLPLVRHLHDRPARSAPALGLHAAGRVLTTPGVTVVPSESMRAQLRRLGVHAQLIPNGIDLAALPAAPATRAELGVPDDAILVVLAGRLQRWKGQVEAIRALAVARQRMARPVAARQTARTATPDGNLAVDDGATTPSGGAQLHLLVLGDALYGLEPTFPAELRQLVRDLRLDDEVTFSGHRDDALAVIAAADVVLHASLEPEPFGMVVLEGMALGRAVVASRSGGPAELIADRQTGVLVEPGDIGAMADALVALARDPARRAALGAAASRAIGDGHGAQAVADAWTATYRDLARR